MTPEQWKQHAYPLTRVTVQVQGIRHTDRAGLIIQLENALTRLRAGELAEVAQSDRSIFGDAESTHR